MNIRLQQLITAEGLNNRRFAEKMGIQSSNVSHIVNGRNKPGYDFIARMLEVFPNINPYWLILGHGNMYKVFPDDSTAPVSIPAALDSLYETDSSNIMLNEQIMGANTAPTSRINRELDASSDGFSMHKPSSNDSAHTAANSLQTNINAYDAKNKTGIESDTETTSQPASRNSDFLFHSSSPKSGILNFTTPQVDIPQNQSPTSNIDRSNHLDNDQPGHRAGQNGDPITPSTLSDNTIDQIVIFYTNGTFRTYQKH